MRGGVLRAHSSSACQSVDHSPSPAGRRQQGSFPAAAADRSAPLNMRFLHIAASYFGFWRVCRMRRPRSRQGLRTKLIHPCMHPPMQTSHVRHARWCRISRCQTRLSKNSTGRFTFNQKLSVPVFRGTLLAGRSLLTVPTEVVRNATTTTTAPDEACRKP